MLTGVELIVFPVGLVVAWLWAGLWLATEVRR